MKLVSGHATNFGSYSHLDFEFNDVGLVLIKGSTGSGKSTLCDLPSWVLYAFTAKGGSVDEIINWSKSGPTNGQIETLLDNGKTLIVNRTRGKVNDLWFTIDNGPQQRGANLNDTQKLINAALGVDTATFLSASYFHEFSQTAQFFTTTAKNRRSICEQVVDLSLAKSLQEKASIELKQATTELAKVNNQIDKASSEITLLTKMQTNELNKFDTWAKTQVTKISVLETQVLRFEDNREKRLKYEQNKLQNPICSECGAKKTNHIHSDNHLNIKIEINPYLNQLEQARTEVNPHNGSVKDFSKDIQQATDRLTDWTDDQIAWNKDINDLELLSEVLTDFRGELVKNTISAIEDKTNQLLHDYFDAEIRVSFTIEDSDKLEVSILKDSNTCTYTQLSKGQRGMLKLCFGLSVMSAVQNHHGISIKQIFIDEGTEGLDDNNKMKAVRMLETIALDYDSIYLVEHSETVKAHIDNSYYVSLNNGNSIIAKI